MDQRMEDMIDRQIEGLLDNDKVFTAWDVTKAIRGAGEIVNHWEVKARVHGIFENDGMPDYDRQTMDVGKGGDFPFVYYPDWMSQNELQDCVNMIKGITTTVKPCMTGTTQVMTNNGMSTISNVVFKTNPTSTSTGTPSYIDKEVDQWNRLRFPKAMLAGAGLKAGDEVWVSLDADKMDITVHPKSYILNNIAKDDRIMWKPLVIDEYCNLRLSLSDTKFAANAYRITIDGDTVKATEAK
jgi:hypothetical protein